MKAKDKVKIFQAITHHSTEELLEEALLSILN